MTSQAREDIVEHGNNNSNDYFYNGNGAEYFLMASLSRRKMDAFKLPVDYGFDVLALDPKTAAAKHSDKGTPYYFQVKSVYVSENSSVRLNTGNGIRQVVTVPVKLKKDTLELMKGDRNKAIVICVYDAGRKHEGMEIEDCPSFWFWINGEAIAKYDGDDGGDAMKILVQEDKREDYRICYVNVVYPENQSVISDADNKQNTFVTIGTGYIKKGNAENTVNTELQNQTWVMYHAMNYQNGKYFRLSGFFEEAREGDSH